MFSFGVMPLEVTPSPVGPSSALTSVNNHISASPAISAHFKVLYNVNIKGLVYCMAANGDLSQSYGVSPCGITQFYLLPDTSE